ncbi:Protein of unknown function [Tenacibaculum mesophilum]|uniref:DUF3078 domain-containing protein n=1 Tax=Tenacibaculum mesophilum TaxID=104268 RepID=A0ABM7CG87_9FLAO|nr:DUF3078 domain-containing protein [Tenacibaculum mesophilum]GFE01159.1 protein of unknown function precursor [Alteromonas sp. KUL156]AZJ32789.1 DUF3078 domain-containing protein [Tenacibaculum mesophilum]KAF9658973.1 DUF3078 domain-containing protein [Tenacibaculum mesophilum]QFS28037.1 DUF3078 domain-containing protein [Tenacibaculum mesophilum]SHF74238.1 Protein of unknown function [Tenacibaculum mesophilum]
MKKLLAIAVMFGALTANAQEEKKEEPKEGWKRSGNISFLFNQSAFNNWLAGGTNNISGTIGLNYDFNYTKGDWTWDNKLIASYGLTKLKGEAMQKTDDRLELNSLLGKKASGYWYYSTFFNFKTQMSSTYVSGEQTSHFFSPAYFQFGPGMLWKKHDNLKVNIAPATSKLIYVHKHLTDLGPAFGVEQNETTRYELGAAVNAYYKLDVMKNVSVENILNLYSNYLEDFQNVDIDYTVNVVMKVNKYLSANLSMQAIYDDNAFKGFQTREVFGLGVNYGF